MTLPSTYLAALLLALLSMLCWGSWANTFKLTGRWRFELFYFDYALGVLLAATLAAFTLGSNAGGEGLEFIDNLAIAGKRQIAFGLVAGVIFNLANMLLVAAISIAGMAVAFPIGIGLALVVGVIWSYRLNPQGNPVFLLLGVALVVGAIVVDALAYRAHAQQAGKAQRAGTKGILLSLVSGVLMGSFYPLVEMGKEGLIGLGPYAIAFVFAVGVFFSTFLFNIYFINLPVQGKSIPITDYFKGTKKQHALGVLGGVIWAVGMIANFVAASAPQEVNVGPAVSYALGQGATLISALWGLLVWKEFAGASGSVRTKLALMLILFCGGLGLVSIAPIM